MKLLDSAIGGVGQFKVLWTKWDIRTFVVASFTFQLFLIVVAPFRKRSSRLGIRVTTWLSYLLADWVAAQAVGLITRATEVLDAENELFALWAQFLLVHLGGPDTITALALEDNALWLRTGLHLGTLAYSTLGILVRSATHMYSTLWVLMALMFLAGIFKYLERVMSLFHGRLLEIQEEPVVEYVRELMEDGACKEELSDVEMVRGAFCLFNSYKRLYADLQISRHVRKGIRGYFLMRKPEEAYRMVEIQLNFMYEAMYTKASVINRTAWTILRHVVVLIELAGLVIWCFFIDKRRYSDQDIQITRALVVGAAAVDVLALIRIYISDWSIARLTKSSRIRTRLYNHLLAIRHLKNRNWSWIRRVFLSRWSESIYRIDLECMDLGYMEKVIASLNLVHFGIRQLFVSRKHIPIETWNFIFEVLTKPCDSTQYYLPNLEAPIDIDMLISTALPLHILEYQNILYPWFYTTCDQSLRVVNSADQVYRNIAITIAEYLMYLFMQQPTMMFAAAGKEHVLGAYYNLQNCRNAEFTFPNYSWEEGGGRWKFGILASELVTDSDKEEDPTNHNMLVAINYLHYGQKWKEIARVWVELLCHAAITCRPNVHATRLKEGGQFLSFVWLLMVHLGIGTKTHAPA